MRYLVILLACLTLSCGKYEDRIAGKAADKALTTLNFEKFERDVQNVCEKQCDGLGFNRKLTFEQLETTCSEQSCADLRDWNIVQFSCYCYSNKLCVFYKGECLASKRTPLTASDGEVMGEKICYYDKDNSLISCSGYSNNGGTWWVESSSSVRDTIYKLD